MRTLTLILSALILTLIATEVSAKEGREPANGYSCKIVTGYGTAIGHGPSQLAAKAAAREICGSKLIDQYFAQRGHIDADVTDDLALACVNLECQN